MRILVTGGTGFIGQRVVEKLTARNQDIVILSRQPQPSSTGAEAKASIVAGDIRIFADMVKAVSDNKIDRVIHVAYTLTAEGEANPLLALQVNVLGASHVFETARICAVDRVVFCSSIAAYAPQSLYGERLLSEEENLMKPASIYGATKVLNEFMASRFETRYGLEIPVLRISAVYGTGRAGRGVTAWTTQMVAGAVRSQPVFIKLRAKQLSNFIYVDDVAEQLVRLTLAEKLAHRVYNSGGYPAATEDFAFIVKKYYPHFQVDFDPNANLWPYPHLVDGTRLEKEIDLKIKTPEEGLLEQINQERRLLGQEPLTKRN
ncbi:MAG: NAD(P)-dependent oxidoreductase [Thermodesulfobacteriota bacterium]